MARGFDRPPLWATIFIVVASVTLLVGVPLTANRGAPSAAELAAMDAEATPTTTPAAPTLDDLRANGLSVYVIGDSLSEGYNATTQEQGFRAVLTDELGEDVTATTDFKAGATLAEVADEADLPAAVDLAVVELGTNDVREKTDPANFGERYAELLADVEATRVVCLGVYRSGDVAEALDAAIRDECAAAEGTFVPIDDLFTDKQFVAAKGAPGYPGGGDGGHPNDAGHQAIADRVIAAVGG